MALRPLALDFLPQRFSGAGLAVLAVGVLLALAAFFDTRHVSDELARRRAELAEIQAPPPGAEALRQAGDRAELEQNLQAAKAVAADIRRPWPRLFAALEAAQDEDIALLNFSPDTGRGAIGLSGEARRREAILAYIDKLAKSGVLKNVVLVEDQLQQQDPEKPFRFSLTADWQEGQ